MQTIRTLSRVTAAVAIALAGGYAAAQSQGSERQPTQPGTTQLPSDRNAANPTTAPSTTDRLPANRTGDMPSSSDTMSTPSDATQNPPARQPAREPSQGDTRHAPGTSGGTQAPGTSGSMQAPGTSGSMQAPGTSGEAQAPSGSVGTPSGPPDRVSVDISRLSGQLAQNIGVSEAQIPSTLSLPVGVAASACGVSATDLAPLGSQGAATCSATTASPELESEVRHRMASPMGQSR